jgi:hypothetical protein
MKAAQSVTVLIFIRGVLGSNWDRNNAYPEWTFLGFPQSFHGIAGLAPAIFFSIGTYAAIFLFTLHVSTLMGRQQMLRPIMFETCSVNKKIVA